MYNYAVFILTHKRPHKQLTYDMLRDRGYTGKIYLVVDDLDTTIPEYQETYGDQVVVFDKMKYVESTECGLAEPKINFAVFARNAIEDIAKDLGYKYFFMMDDDLNNLRFRYDDNGSFKSVKITQNLDAIFDAYVEYMAECNIACLGFGIKNNYMRGTEILYSENPRLRMCFNIYLRNADYKVDWLLNMCEDRITSIAMSRSGQVWLQLLNVQLDTVPMGGQIDGGNSEVYNNTDKFHQVFFPVISMPDCNYCTFWKDQLITALHTEAICPKIIGGQYKK